jgi:DNA polymerase III epsilon subunit family exonuclease
MDESRPLAEIDFCAFDLETTGWSSHIRMVELGASRFRLDGECGEPYSTLVDPGVPISPAVIAIHGITDEMVRGAPHAPEALEAFFEFAAGCVLLAHNASFDIGVVSWELTRHELPVPGFKVLDTLRLARRRIPELPNYSLGTIADRLGLFRPCAHRGLPDAEAAREVFREAVRSIEGWESMPLSALKEEAGDLGFRHCAREPAALPEGLEALQQSRVMRIVYDGGTQGLDPRPITPQAVSEDCMHLYAYCHITSTMKSFRIDRILAVLEPED